eukprot:5851006-Pleurochrysis_carterae.AAC.2
MKKLVVQRQTTHEQRPTGEGDNTPVQLTSTQAFACGFTTLPLARKLCLSNACVILWPAASRHTR